MESLSPQEIEQIAEKIASILNWEANKPVGRWLKLREAMDYAKVGKSTIMRWVNEGYIYANKRTGEWIFDRESIDTFYNRGRFL